MVNSSIQTELNRFFQVLDGEPVAQTSATTAAFCKARKKVSSSAFKELNDCAVKAFYQSGKVSLWKEFRLLAIDATVTKLPISDELFSYYGKAREHSRYPAVRMSQLYDVKNKISIDVQVDSHKTGERNLAINHFGYLKEGDLVILDRGYPAVWFFKKILQNKAHFCARIKSDESNILKDFLESEQDDLVLELPCTEKSLRRCKKDGMPTSPIKVRLIKIVLATGEIEILITSLTNQALYPHEMFKNLYHQRWGIEEDYKVMKSRVNIENFSGKSVEAVLQDIHAKVLTKNLAAIAMFDAEAIKKKVVKSRKRQYCINFTHALGLLKGNVIRLMLGMAADNLCHQFITKIAKVLTVIKPDRSFKRPKNNRARVNKYPMAYKRAC